MNECVRIREGEREKERENLNVYCRRVYCRVTVESKHPYVSLSASLLLIFCTRLDTLTISLYNLKTSDKFLPKEKSSQNTARNRGDRGTMSLKNSNNKKYIKM